MSMYYFDDLSPGQVFETPGRTISESDLLLFAGMTGDNSALHTDEAYSSQSIYGQRLVHGMLVLSISSGLMARTLVFEKSGIAFLGMENVVFRKPVFIGDTVHVRFTIEYMRETSKADRGLVSRRVEVLNQTGEIVLDYLLNGLVLRKAAT